MTLDQHLTCAATIGAYQALVMQAIIPPDEELAGLWPLAQMWHLNAYSFPQQLDEPDAFARLAVHRDEIISSVPSEEILQLARECAANIPE